MHYDQNDLSKDYKHQSAKARNCQSRRIASILIIEGKRVHLRNVNACIECGSFGVDQLEMRDVRHEFIKSIDIAWGLNFEQGHVVNNLKAIDHLPHLAHRA